MISKQEFVIFDVETTGLSPDHGDRIIEFAAMRIRGRNMFLVLKHC